MSLFTICDQVFEKKVKIALLLAIIFGGRTFRDWLSGFEATSSLRFFKKTLYDIFCNFKKTLYLCRVKKYFLKWKIYTRHIINF